MEIMVGVRRKAGSVQAHGVFLMDCQTKEVREVTVGEYKGANSDRSNGYIMKHAGFIKEACEVEVDNQNGDVCVLADTALMLVGSYDYNSRTLSGLKATETYVNIKGIQCESVTMDDNERNRQAVKEVLSFAEKNAGSIVLNGALIPSMQVIYRCKEDGSISSQGEHIGSYELSQLDYIAVCERGQRVCGFITGYKGEYFLVPMFVHSDYDQSQYVPLGVTGNKKETLCTVAYLEVHGGEPVSVGACLCKAHAGTMREQLMKQNAFPSFSYATCGNVYSASELIKESGDAMVSMQISDEAVGRGKAWLLNGVLDYNTIADWTETDLEMFRATHTKPETGKAKR